MNCPNCGQPMDNDPHSGLYYCSFGYCPGIQANIETEAAKLIEAQMRQVINPTIGTCTEAKPASITLGEIQKAIDLVYPVLYYATAQFIEREIVYKIKETDFGPECIVCHPDDLEKLKEIIKGRRFVNIKDEPKDKQMERIMRNLRKIGSEAMS